MSYSSCCILKGGISGLDKECEQGRRGAGLAFYTHLPALSNHWRAARGRSMGPTMDLLPSSCSERLAPLLHSSPSNLIPAQMDPISGRAWWPPAEQDDRFWANKKRLRAGLQTVIVLHVGAGGPPGGPGMYILEDISQRGQGRGYTWAAR